MKYSAKEMGRMLVDMSRGSLYSLYTVWVDSEGSLDTDENGLYTYTYELRVGEPGGSCMTITPEIKELFSKFFYDESANWCEDTQFGHWLEKMFLEKYDKKPEKPIKPDDEDEGVSMTQVDYNASEWKLNNE